MRKFWFTAALTCLFPAAASAVIRVNIDQTGLRAEGDHVVATLEVYAQNDDPAQDEQLNAFTIALEGTNFSPTGVRFVTPPPNPASGWIPFGRSTTHPYVFGAFPGNIPEDPSAGSDYNTVRLSAVLSGTDSVDITPALNGFGKFEVIYPNDTPAGVYPVVFDDRFLSFGSRSGAPLDVRVFTGFVTPEPSSMGLLLGAGLLALRRRRAA